ncbi:hypothetical protein [Senegalia massiliensis]|nr:hypothetical protein [Senegalia massiliensis]
MKVFFVFSLILLTISTLNLMFKDDDSFIFYLPAAFVMWTMFFKGVI